VAVAVAAQPECCSAPFFVGPRVSLQVAGRAKFPFLSLQSTEADMGAVVVGCSSRHELQLGNASDVPANFSVWAAGRGDGAFSISPMQ